jgi:hypothetical protein
MPDRKVMTDFTYWLQIVLTVLPLLCAGAYGWGTLREKIHQLEKRLGGNGHSIPSRCVKHSTKLEDIERRLDVVETGE